MAEYLSALWAHWVALMSGVVGLLIGISLRVGRKISQTISSWSDIPDWAFIGIGAIALFWASYAAWCDQFKEVSRLKTELESARDAGKPKLGVQIMQVSSGPAGGTAIGNVIFLIVSVSNSGADSIAGGYRLRVDRPDGSHASIKPLLMRDGFTCTAKDGTTIKYVEADAIYEKTSVPIKSGDKKSGPLIYFQAKNEPLPVGGDKLTVTVLDFLGKEYSGEMILTERDSTLLYFPGSGGKVSSKD
jgi:hypothetical protein